MKQAGMKQAGMKQAKRFSMALLGVLAVALAFGKSETVTGQLIDLACYSLDKDNTGNHHKHKGLLCARACALEGFAVGLLTADGTVYEVTGELTANTNAKLAPHMAQTVTLTGEVREANGKTTIAANDLKSE
jgi:hypothetical protein